LITHAFSSQELPSLIEAILSSKDERKNIRHLHMGSAQVLIDIMDKVRSSSARRTEYLHWG
jgi:hypothetical protein